MIGNNSGGRKTDEYYLNESPDTSAHTHAQGKEAADCLMGILLQL